MLKTFCIHTYGCQMNVHESEKIAGILKAKGYIEIKEDMPSDIIVFNTCCIRDTAEARALGNIGRVKPYKKAHPDTVVAVVGCMTQQKGFAEGLKEKFPFVDIILGTADIYMIGDRVENVLNGRKSNQSVDMNERPVVAEGTPIARTSYPNAWINITYGCDNFCTYCIVPYVRGRERSRSESAVMDDVKRVLDQGYKEITLLGQNVNSFGHDLSDGSNFERLLHKISGIAGKFRVRFMTSHPKDLTEGVIEEIAGNTVICDNIHLPVQSGSNRILKSMNRKYTREYYFELVEKIRQRIPYVGLTSDVMVGFPGENDEDFSETLDLVTRVKYQNAFTFVYSPRKGTVAAAMEQLPEEVKTERIKELIKVQNSITKELSDGLVGKTEEILAESFDKEKGLIQGRTDGGRMVSAPGKEAMIGEFLKIKIEKSKSASLTGSLEK